MRVRPNILAHGVASLILLGAHSAGAVTRYVDAAATGANTGNNWTNAYVGLQAGLTACTASDEVWVKTGTYTGNFTMAENVSAYGGFQGNETQFSQRDTALYPTTIDGNGGIAIGHPAATGGQVLDGFTLTGCGNSAVYSYRSLSFTVRNCTFINNTGAAAYRQEMGGTSTCLVERCTFIGNTAGAIYQHGRENGFGAPPPWALTIDKCLFVSNSTSGNGAAIELDYTSDWVKIFNCVFWANSAVEGGAVSTQPTDKRVSEIELWNCTFFDNTASSGHGHDARFAATFEESGTIDVYNSIFWGTNWSQIYVDEGNSATLRFGIGNSCLQNGLSSIEVFDAPNGDSFISDYGANVGSDPIFFNRGEGNLALFRGSPCIDTGISNGVPPELARDIEWGERPMGEGYDMGAYEYLTPIPKGTTIMVYGIGK